MTQDNNMLQVCLLGSMDVCQGSIQASPFPTLKSRSLFARLVLAPGHHFTRDALSESLWPDYSIDKARKCLRSELWRVRKVLAFNSAQTPSYINVNRTSIWFHTNDEYFVDVLAFERLFNSIRNTPTDRLSSDSCRILLECVKLYQGDLLEMLDSEWVLLRREELKLRYLTALELLMHYFMRNEDWSNAVEFGRQLLTHDPLLEHIHLYMMQCYIAMGHRSSAIMQYQQCRSRMRDELGISPMPAIEELYQSTISRQPTPGNQQGLKIFESLSRHQSIIDNIQQALYNVTVTQQILQHTHKQINE